MSTPSMTTAEIAAAIIARRTPATPEEIDVLVRDGTLAEVAAAMVQGGCTQKPLRDCYRELYRQSQNPR